MLFRAVRVRQAFALRMLLLPLLVSKAVTVLFVAWLLLVLLAVPIGRVLLCTVQPPVLWLAGIRTARFVVFLLFLLDRTVFPVRQLLLGMVWLPVQLPGRPVKRAFVVLLLWEQLFLLVRMAFLVRAVWLLVQCLAPLLVLCVAYRPQVLRRRQELTGKALLLVLLAFLQVRMRLVFAVWALSLLDRMVFPVRRLPLGMKRQRVQLQERLVKQAFVVWQLRVLWLLPVRTAFPVRQRPLVTVRPKPRPAVVLARFAA